MGTSAENPALSIDTLIAELDNSNDAGTDVREDDQWADMYTTLRDTRKELRRAERSSINEEQLVNNSINANWDPIILQSMHLLRTTSKDVEIAAWLIEGLVRRAGISGLLRGYTYLKKLLETYGNKLHPREDSENNITSLNAIQSLSGGYSLGTLVLPLNIAPWFEKHQGQITNWHYTQAKTTSQANKNEKNSPTLADLDSLVMKMESKDIAHLRHSIEVCIRLNNDISDIATQMDPENGVSLGNIRTTLDEILTVVKRLHHMKNKKIEVINATPEVENSQENNNTELEIQNTEIASKQDAIVHLKKAYNYFMQMQPHSPVTYSLARSIEWCDMSLSELLDELMPNNSAKKIFCKIAGIPASSEKNIHESAMHFSDSD